MLQVCARYEHVQGVLVLIAWQYVGSATEMLRRLAGCVEVIASASYAA
jgi:hypothetical protein